MLSPINLKKLWLTSLSALIMLAILLAAAPDRALAQTGCSRNYTVKSGDTLYGIALSHKVTLQALADANELKPPYTIYIGESLCIPGSTTSGSSSSGSTTSSKGASYTVTRVENSIVIKTQNFPANSFFNVKVDDGNERGYQWFKLGMLRIRKNTAISVEFRLPKDLRSTDMFNICMKNVVTDAVSCRRVPVTLP